MNESEKPRVKRVQEALVIMDDFLSARQIAELTGMSASQVASSICYLQRMQVIDAVQSHGELFWFLTGDDLRTRQRERLVAGYTRTDPNGRKGGKRRHLVPPKKELPWCDPPQP